MIGGVRALGEVGDWRISNGRVRFVVQDIKVSRGFGAYGGSLLDADLARPDETADPRTGLVGKDGLGELFPAFFLGAIEPTEMKLVSDGSNGGTARLRIYGTQSEFITATRLLDNVALGSGLEYVLDYALAPEDDYLQITASISNPSPAPHDFAVGTFPIPVGFIALFGDGQPVFMPGEAGFDQRYSLQRSYARTYPLPTLPGITSDVVAVEGDGVSYGLSYCSSCTSPLAGGVPPGAGFVWNHQDVYARYAPVTTESMQVPFISGTLFGVFMGEAPRSLGGGKSISTTLRLRVAAPGASQQVDATYRDQGLETGTVAGYVREEVTQATVAGAEVVVFAGSTLDAATGRPSGIAVTAARADEGGRFHANLPAGRYTAIARALPHPSSAPMRFDVALHQTTDLEPHVGRPAWLAVEVVDETGRRLPAKVTLDAAYDAKHTGEDPKTFLYDLRVGDPYRPTDLITDSAADPETRRYIETTLRTLDGRVQAAVRPGKYRVTVSRGPAYTLFQQEVDLPEAAATTVAASIRRVIPAGNRVAADLHVHSVGSVDADVSFDDRVLSYAAEGIDFLATTDHNAIEDLIPNIQRLGLGDFLQATRGEELSSLEAGHWNAYPLKYDQTAAAHGAIAWWKSWPPDAPGEAPSVGQRAPQLMFDALRAQGTWGAADTVVQVNHPRDSIQGYFSSYGFTGDALTGDPAHDWPGKGGTFAPSGPGFGPGVFSLDFDAIELLTGKRFDLLHTYRVPSPPPPDPVPIPCSVPHTASTVCMGPPGSIVRDSVGNGGVVEYPGSFEDWEHLLDSGRVYSAVANSDSHSLLNGEAGYPRNLIDLGHGWDTARGIDEREVARAVKAGRVTATVAPDVQLTAIDPAAAAGALPVELPQGSLVKPDAQGAVHMHVVVRAAPWVDVQRISLVVGGSCDETAGDCHLQPLQFHPTGLAAGAVARFDSTLCWCADSGLQCRASGRQCDLATTHHDTWFAVVVEGDKTLWPVLIPLEVPPLLLNDAIASLSATFGIQDAFGNLKPSQVRAMTPWALTNPILVDGNGDGAFGTRSARRAEDLARAPPPPGRAGQGDSARLVDLQSALRTWAR